MRREIAKRLAGLEARLLPPPRVYWSPWQRLLSDEEYGLVVELASRGATYGGDRADVSTWHDDWPAWATLCHDEHERGLLARIKAVSDANPEAPERLADHLTDLKL